MYDNKYMSHMVGRRKVSIFLTNCFSSSGVQVKSSETSMCFVVSMTLTSPASDDWCVDDMVFFFSVPEVGQEENTESQHGFGWNELLLMRTKAHSQA